MSQLSRSAEYFSSLQLALGTKSTITTAAFSKSFFQQNIILFHTTSYQEPKRQNHRTFPKMLYNMKYTSVIILGFLNALAFAVPTTPGEWNSSQSLMKKGIADCLSAAKMQVPRGASKNAPHSLPRRSSRRWQSSKRRVRPPSPLSLLL